MKNVSPLVLTAALLALGLTACERDATYESGEPDARPAPTTDAEAAAQKLERMKRQTALQAAGLCTPEAKRQAPEPDERFWHCRGLDWDGSTAIKDELARLSDPELHRQYCATPTFDALGIRFMLCEGVDFADARQGDPR